MACPGSCIWRGHAGETGSFTVSTVGSRYYGAPDGFPFGAGSAGQRVDWQVLAVSGSSSLVGQKGTPPHRPDSKGRLLSFPLYPFHSTLGPSGGLAVKSPAPRQVGGALQRSPDR